MQRGAKEMRMAQVQTSSGVIGVTKTDGGPAGGPILFLHGVGSDKSVWEPQLAHFRATRMAIAFDYPGYGESEFRTQATRDDYARAAFAVLDAVGVESAHICGLSLGGVVAIAMHALAPGRCRSLVLADTFALHPEGRGIYERSVAGSSDMRAFAEARADFLLAQPAFTSVRSEVVATMSRIDPAAYRIGAEGVWLADQRERARAIDVATLIICGEQDRPTPPDLSKELGALIAGSRVEMITGAGHLTNLERPAQFNRLLDEFLATFE
jgi:3-oxoadipate enol-lactonase